jgi:hypothetical protein
MIRIKREQPSDNVRGAMGIAVGIAKQKSRSKNFHAGRLP